MQKIIYKDKERDVYTIAKPSDCYFMLDLTEYTEEEKDFYLSEYKRLHKEFLQAVKDVGLSSNYRNFKEDKIEWINKETS
jgi:hypothetical protein